MRGSQGRVREESGSRRGQESRVRSQESESGVRSQESGGVRAGRVKVRVRVRVRVRVSGSGSGTGQGLSQMKSESGSQGSEGFERRLREGSGGGGAPEGGELQRREGALEEGLGEWAPEEDGRGGLRRRSDPFRQRCNGTIPKHDKTRKVHNVLCGR